MSFRTTIACGAELFSEVSLVDDSRALTSEPRLLSVFLNRASILAKLEKVWECWDPDWERLRGLRDVSVQGPLKCDSVPSQTAVKQSASVAEERASAGVVWEHTVAAYVLPTVCLRTAAAPFTHV